MLIKLKKFKVHIISISDYKKINDCKIIWQKHYDKIKNYACVDWIVLDAITNHTNKIFEC